MDPTPTQAEPFFLIVADHDRGTFCVEGPMTDDGPWKRAAGRAREHERRVQCGPAGPDRDRSRMRIPTRATSLAALPPGSILRPRG